ncbi:MAG: Gfo/Idh/MocA family oxidoreductase [Planctomycetaceae bacterium]|jgi:biopolymer transport protein ExbD|nr:Gfo/Idh/MocA family oxidoreductase [Planctomycetaceae bacterium]
MKNTTLFLFVFLSAAAVISAAAEPFRIGVIGTTTSHVPAFAKAFNNPNAAEPLNGFKVVAAYPGGMPDNPNSWNRVKEYADGLVKDGAKVYNTIEEMLPNVDGILLESVDGRPHLEQAKPVIAAGKPLYIDKPMAGTLADVITIFRLAKEKNVPVFSASSLRYSPEFQKVLAEKTFGDILGCDAWSPCTINDKHPDLFWYGVHGVETLFTLMGPGCVSVSRTQTAGTEVVAGVWKDGRIGTFRGTRTGKHDYGAVVFGSKDIGLAGKYGGYEPLAAQIAQFFKTGKAPVAAEESIEIFAFMEAADRSKITGGSAALADVIADASQEVSVSAAVRIAADGTLTLNGKEITVGSLAAALDGLVGGKANHRVKVILKSEKGVPIETVQKVCSNLGKAMLANYIYDYQ